MAAEEDVQIFLEEIQDLTQYMKDLNRTVMALDSAIMEKFGVAVKKNTETVNSTTKLLDQFGREIKEATKETKAAVQAQKDAAAEARREAESTRRKISDNMRQRSTANELFREFGQGVDATRLMRQHIENLGGDSLAATAGLKAFTAGVEGIVKATTVMASALYRGERGATVSAKALTELVAPLAELGTTIGTMIAVLSVFGPAGLIGRGLKFFGLALGALGLATKAATKYNELAAEQTDKLFKSFNELSKSGIGISGGFDKVFEMAQTLGLTVAELEEFNRLLTTNTQTLSLFGGTAAKGAEKFAGAAGTLVKQFGRELEAMGVTQAEQRELAMGYMNIQARTGQIMNKSVAQLAAESAKYIKELDMLAELTGSTRKQQQEVREAAMAEARFRAARIEAERRGDTEQVRRLDVAMRAAGIAKAAGDTRGFTGILQAAAGRGALTTPEAIAAEQTYRISEILQKPNPTDVDIQSHMAKSVDLQQRQLGGTNALIGNLDVIQTNLVAADDLRRRQLVLAEEANKAGYGKTNEGIQKYLQDIQEGRVKASPDTQKVIDANRMQQNAALMMDSGIRTFNGAAALSMQASQTFANAVSAMPGAKIVGGGLGTGAAGGAAGGAGGAAGGAGGAGALASKIVKAEGGSVTARNPYSSASGLGQITKGRYEQLVKEAPTGHQLKGTSFEQYRQDAGLQQAALDYQISNLKDYLQRQKLPSTDAAVYMAHVFGPAGARHILTSGDNVEVSQLIDPKIISTNKAIFGQKGEVHTVGQLKKVISDKMGGTGYQFGGIAMGPKSGYSAILHGNEAVVPLPDGRNIPVTMPEFNSSMREQVAAMGAQITKLDELISLMRNQNNISSRILQASHA